MKLRRATAKSFQMFLFAAKRKSENFRETLKFSAISVLKVILLKLN